MFPCVLDHLFPKLLHTLYPTYSFSHSISSPFFIRQFQLLHTARILQGIDNVVVPLILLFHLE